MEAEQKAKRQTFLLLLQYSFFVSFSLFPTGESKLPQNRRQQVFGNGTLIINNVDRSSDEGSYRCIAENKEGESAFRDVGVKVMGESIFQSGKTSTNNCL